MPRNLKEIVRLWFWLLEQLLQDINTSKSDCRNTVYNKQTLFFWDFLKSISQTTDCEQLHSIRDVHRSNYLDTTTLGQGNWLLKRFCLLSNSLETSTPVATSQPTGIFWQQNWHSSSETLAKAALWRRLSLASVRLQIQYILATERTKFVRYFKADNSQSKWPYMLSAEQAPSSNHSGDQLFQ